jgi:BMFP domain-containing protein YqiC
VESLTKLPWDEREELEHAGIAAVRADDTEAAAAIIDRLNELDAHLADVGTMLLVAAVRGGSQKVAEALEPFFNERLKAAWDRANKAGRRATEALERIDALEQRIRELEEQYDSATCGIGDPDAETVLDTAGTWMNPSHAPNRAGLE